MKYIWPNEGYISHLQNLTVSNFVAAHLLENSMGKYCEMIISPPFFSHRYVCMNDLCICIMYTIFLVQAIFYFHPYSPNHNWPVTKTLVICWMYGITLPNYIGIKIGLNIRIPKKPTSIKGWQPRGFERCSILPRYVPIVTLASPFLAFWMLGSDLLLRGGLNARKAGRRWVYMDYLPTWKVENGHIQREMYIKYSLYMEQWSELWTLKFVWFVNCVLCFGWGVGRGKVGTLSGLSTRIYPEFVNLIYQILPAHSLSPKLFHPSCTKFPTTRKKALWNIHIPMTDPWDVWYIDLDLVDFYGFSYR